MRFKLSEDTTFLGDLSAVFDGILRELRGPWFSEAHIDPNDYLPVVDDEGFDMLSVGGARKTLVNLAYHLANLYMSISERSLMLLPTLLIVDSPRKNVGDNALDRTMVESVYARLQTLQAASRDDFQIIFADNDMPGDASKWISKHIELDYENPFVPGVVHRGEAESNDPKDAIEVK